MLGAAMVSALAGCGTTLSTLQPAEPMRPGHVQALGACYVDGPASRPPWWAWFLLIPAFLVVAVLGMWLLDKLFSGIEWLAFSRRRCPRCGKRRWSWGFTRGFGL